MEFWPFGVSYPSYPRAYPRQRPTLIDPFPPVHGFSNSRHPHYYRDVPSSLDDYASGPLFPSYGYPVGYPLRQSATPLLRKQRAQKSPPRRKPTNSPIVPSVTLSGHGDEGLDNYSTGDEESCCNSPVVALLAHNTEPNTCNQADDQMIANVETTTQDIGEDAVAIVPGDEETVLSTVASVNGGEMDDTAAIAPGESVETAPSISVEEVKKRLEDVRLVETKIESLRTRIDEYSDSEQCGGKEQLYLTETLISYLLQLDKILAEGNDDIRLARKQVVLKIGKYIEEIENKAVDPALSNGTMEEDASDEDTTANMSADGTL